MQVITKSRDRGNEDLPPFVTGRKQREEAENNNCSNFQISTL
jgi:hypothetical protein